MGPATSIAGPKDTAGVHYALVVLGFVVLAVFGSLGLARFGYTTILPAMQDALHLSNAQTGELQSWNLVGYLLTVVFAGLLATRFGPRRVVAIALAVTGAAMIVTGLTPSFNGARLGRFLAGVGGAGANVPAMALLSAWFSTRRRGVAAGIGVAGSSVGLMVTGFAVPKILQHYPSDGWRICWYLLGTTAIVISVLCAVFLCNRPAEKGMLPIGQAATDPAPASLQQTASALNWSLVYRSRVIWHLAAVYFAFGFSYIIYSTFFIRYLVKEAGWTQADAGMFWMIVGMVSGISGLIWGGVSDRFGRRVALLAVFLLQGGSFLLFGAGRQSWCIYASAGLFALTAWSIPALMAALAGDVFGVRLAPAALGLVTIVFGIGQALGPYAAGCIADATHSFSPAFMLAAVAAFGGGIGCLFLRRADASQK